jgi:hypothetical protein
VDIICTSYGCGHANPPGSKFCNQCGHGLPKFDPNPPMWLLFTRFNNGWATNLPASATLEDAMTDLSRTKPRLDADGVLALVRIAEQQDPEGFTLKYSVQEWRPIIQQGKSYHLLSQPVDAPDTIEVSMLESC